MSDRRSDAVPRPAADVYVARLHAQYEARHKHFSLLLGGVNAFGALFLLFILLPFASLRRQERAIAADLGKIRLRLTTIEAETLAYRRSLEALADLDREIRRGPAELRSNILRASSPSYGAGVEPNMPMQQSAQQTAQQVAPPQGLPRAAGPEAGCAAERDRDALMQCVTRATLDEQFLRYRELVDGQVLAPLRALPPSESPRVDSTAIHGAVSALRAAVDRKLRDTPRFWERFEGKVSFYAELNEFAVEKWEEIGLPAQLASLRAAKAAADSSRARLAVDSARVRGRESELATRLAHVDSPFGKLPVGIVEGVHVFPVLLAVGFLMCCTALAESVRLRRALDAVYSAPAPGPGLSPSQIALIAPLWIDAGDAAQDRRTRTAALLAPLAMSVVAGALVAYAWRVAAEPLLPAPEALVYATIYAVSLAAAAVSFRRLRLVLASGHP